MLFSLYIFSRFMIRDCKPTKFKPVYVKTWGG